MNFLYSWTNRLYQTFAGPNVESTWDVRDALRTDALKDLSTHDSRETPAAARKKSSMSIREEGEEEEEEEEDVDPGAIASAEDERIHAEDAGYAASMRKEAYDICMDRTTADTKSRILEGMYTERLTESSLTERRTDSLVMCQTVAHTDRTKTKAKHSLTSDLTVYKVAPSVHPDDWLLPCTADADFTDALEARKEHEEHVRKTMHAVARDICVDALAPLSSHLQLTDSSPPKDEQTAAEKCVTCNSFIVGHVEHRLAHRVGKETLLHVEHNLDKARQVLLQYCDECLIMMVLE